MMKLVFLFLLCLPSGFCLQCFDNNGKPVDWFYIYKIPESHSHKSGIFKEGLAYVYLDVHSPQWIVSKTSINGTDNAVYYTLEQIYKTKGDSILYMMYNDERPDPSNRGGGHTKGMYNDERPDPSNRGGGHTKGVMAFDKQSGFWMVHSSPGFPPERHRSYEWTATIYGQSVMCMSLGYKQIHTVGTQMMYNEPHVYDYMIPDDFAKDFPVLKNVLSKKRPPGPPWSSILKLTTLAGQTFVSFAKSGKFGADLYDALVAPALKTDLLVETWLRTSGEKLPSNCTCKYKVLKVTHITLPGGNSFNETKDHAKWAVSYSKDMSSLSSTPWTCVGDINRMHSQFRRGGGTVCLQNYSVWKSFYSSIDNYSHC